MDIELNFLFKNKTAVCLEPRTDNMVEMKLYSQSDWQNKETEEILLTAFMNTFYPYCYCEPISKFSYPIKNKNYTIAYSREFSIWEK